MVDRTYGPEGPRPLAYHNLLHTDDVITAARVIGGLAVERRIISPSELDTILLAAAFHDVVHGVAGGVNERRSAEIAVGRMNASGAFDLHETDAVRDMILATEVIGFDGTIVRNVNPRDPKTLIIADADLCAFGMPESEALVRVKRYFTETTGKRPDEKHGFLSFLFGQHAVIGNHRFLTPEAAELYPHTAANAAAMLAVQACYAAQ